MCSVACRAGDTDLGSQGVRIGLHPLAGPLWRQPRGGAEGFQTLQWPSSKAGLGSGGKENPSLILDGAWEKSRQRVLAGGLLGGCGSCPGDSQHILGPNVFPGAVSPGCLGTQEGGAHATFQGTWPSLPADHPTPGSLLPSRQLAGRGGPRGGLRSRAGGAGSPDACSPLDAHRCTGGRKGLRPACARRGGQSAQRSPRSQPFQAPATAPLPLRTPGSHSRRGSASAPPLGKTARPRPRRAPPPAGADHAPLPLTQRPRPMLLTSSSLPAPPRARGSAPRSLPLRLEAGSALLPGAAPGPRPRPALFTSSSRFRPRPCPGPAPRSSPVQSLSAPPHAPHLILAL